MKNLNWYSMDISWWQSRSRTLFLSAQIGKSVKPKFIKAFPDWNGVFVRRRRNLLCRTRSHAGRFHYHSSSVASIDGNCVTNLVTSFLFLVPAYFLHPNFHRIPTHYTQNPDSSSSSVWLKNFHRPVISFHFIQFSKREDNITENKQLKLKKKV